MLPEMVVFNVVIRHVEAESRSRIKEEDISVFGGKQNEGGYSCPEKMRAQRCIFHLFEPNDQPQSRNISSLKPIYSLFIYYCWEASMPKKGQAAQPFYA